MEPPPELNAAGDGMNKPGTGFALFASDQVQALRMRRYLMAAATSLLIIVLLFISAGFRLLPLEAAIRGSCGIAVTIVFFYALLRSGLNLRFRDPSLTAEQIAAAILFLGYILYHAPQSRGMLIILYIMPLTFGMLKLRTRRLLALAALTLAVHATVLLLSSAAPDPQSAAAQLIVLAVVLPWLALMGGYVNQLRARLSDSNRNLTAAFDRIEQIAIRDALTGVFNRRHLLDVLERERSRSARLRSPLSLCLFDLDHFKSVNDHHGHAAGDLVLTRVAQLGSMGLRANDVFGRYGGEEFLLVLPDTDRNGAVTVAERIRARIEQAEFADVAPDFGVTVTIGITSIGQGETVAACIARADKALYAGKSAGRNRVAVE